MGGVMRINKSFSIVGKMLFYKKENWWPYILSGVKDDFEKNETQTLKITVW